MALRTLTLGLVFLFGGCNRETQTLLREAEPLEAASNNSLYVAESDFTSGAVQKIDLVTGKLSAPFPAHADSTVRWDPYAKRAIVVNRLAGNHLSIASADLGKVLLQIPLPVSSNPQDVLPLGDGQAYVSSLSSPRLSRWDLSTGQPVGEGVDLSQWNDRDGSPEPTALIAHRRTVHVFLARLDTKTYLPSGKSFAISIDPKTDDVVGVRPLKVANPFAPPKIIGDDLFVGESGIIDRQTPNTDGLIEQLEAATLKPKGVAITEKELGGDLLDFEMLDASHGVAIISTPQTKLVSFDLGTAQVKEVLPPGTLRYSQVVVDRERALYFVLDRDLSGPCVRVFDFNDEERVENRVFLPLPPFQAVLAP